MPEFDFVISDESINDRGGRVLTKGINLKNFKKNPVGFYNHHRSCSAWSGADSTKILPVIKWKNLKKEPNGRLTGTAVFDENDEFSMSLASKVENGYINSVSVGLEILAISYDEKDLVKGQTRGTITKSNLREISIVDIPGNPNATKLAGGGQLLMLSAAGTVEEDIESVLPLIQEKKSTNMPLLKNLSALFVKVDEGNEEEVNKAAVELKAEVEETEKQVETLTAEIEAKNKEIEDLKADQETKNAELKQLKVDLKAEQDKVADFETRLTDLEGKLAAQVEHTKKIVSDNNLNAETVEQSGGSQVETTTQDKEEKREELASMSREDRGLAAYYEALELRQKQKETGAEVPAE